MIKDILDNNCLVHCNQRHCETLKQWTFFELWLQGIFTDFQSCQASSMFYPNWQILMHDYNHLISFWETDIDRFNLFCIFPTETHFSPNQPGPCTSVQGTLEYLGYGVTVLVILFVCFLKKQYLTVPPTGIPPFHVINWITKPGLGCRIYTHDSNWTFLFLS